MVIIFGLGFTGARLGRRLLEQGVETWAPVRRIDRFRHLADAGLRLLEFGSVLEAPALLPEGADVALLVPPLPEPQNANLRKSIRMSKPRRIVYVSSTGVYGDQSSVDAGTIAVPSDDRGVRRIGEEQWISSGPWSHLILRTAAIYGPGRGVHAAMREGRIPRGSDSGIVSRIHVDDLVATVEAGLFSDVQGAWPVADETPCPTSEIVRWFIEVSGMKPSFGAEDPVAPGQVSIQGRSVNGRKIRELLEVSLKYPSWKSGLAASLLEEHSQGRQ